MAGKLLEWAEQDLIPKFTSWNKQNPQGDAVQSGRYRPDFTWVSGDGVVILEHDEEKHARYTKRCELVRMGEVGVGYGGQPVYWVRFNPDGFKVAGATRKIGKDERHAMVLKLLDEALAMPDYEHLITICYVCYDKPHTDAESDLVQTFKFKDYEAFCVWADVVAPA